MRLSLLFGNRHCFNHRPGYGIDCYCSRTFLLLYFFPWNTCCLNHWHGSAWIQSTRIWPVPDERDCWRHRPSNFVWFIPIVSYSMKDEIMCWNMNRETGESCTCSILEMAEDRRSTQNSHSRFRMDIISNMVQPEVLSWVLLLEPSWKTLPRDLRSKLFTLVILFFLSLSLYSYVWKFRIVFFQKSSQIHWWTLRSSFPHYVTEMM